MDGRLEGEVVLVTGAARGIGKAVAEVAAGQGAAVGLVDVDPAGQAVASGLQAAGRQAVFAQADITSEAAVERAVTDVAGRLGAVSVLVNNAGRNAYHDPVAMTVSDWNEVFDVDLKGAWLMARAVLPGMIASQRGSIVNVASIHASLTIAGLFPYAAAKSGLVGLTRSLALDVARHGIRVNAVSPGFVRTWLVEEWLTTCEDPVAAEKKMLESQPLGRIGNPEDIAEVICFLACPAAAFVTGAEWAVDGGLGARFA